MVCFFIFFNLEDLGVTFLNGKEIIYENNTYGRIILNRPQKKNAISIRMAEQLLVILDKIKKDLPKFLVIKSAGDDIFCSGGDLNDLHGDLDEIEASKRLTSMKEVLFKLATLPIPTICLLQENAFGGGCELATACDFRIAKENTKFGFIQSNLGILPGWGGGAILYERVNASFAYQWIVEGKIFSVDYLQQKGWIHEIIKAEQWNEEELVDNYIAKSVQQLHFLKKQYLASISIDNLRKRMGEESYESALLWPSPEHKEAVKKFLHK